MVSSSSILTSSSGGEACAMDFPMGCKSISSKFEESRTSLFLQEPRQEECSTQSKREGVPSRLMNDPTEIQ